MRLVIQGDQEYLVFRCGERENAGYKFLGEELDLTVHIPFAKGYGGETITNPGINGKAYRMNDPEIVPSKSLKIIENIETSMPNRPWQRYIITAKLYIIFSKLLLMEKRYQLRRLL